MANAFQHTAFQQPGFQTLGGFTPTPSSRDTRHLPAGKSKKKRQRSVVEIDGEEFIVSSEAEAQALLEQAQELAQTQAAVAAKSALNKARKLKRKTGTMPTLEVAVPEVKFLSGDADVGEMVAAAQRMIDEIYLMAAREATLALEIKQQLALAQEEDDVITLLLLG